MRPGFMTALLTWGLLLASASVMPASAEEADQPPASYDLNTLDCGELDGEAGLRPMRPSHIAGEELDILCKVTVALAPPTKSKGLPKPHTIKLTALSGAGQKVAFEQVRDTHLLTPGTRVILFVIPAEKLPAEPGKVSLRVELSKPASKPNWRETSYEVVAED